MSQALYNLCARKLREAAQRGAAYSGKDKSAYFSDLAAPGQVFVASRDGGAYYAFFIARNSATYWVSPTSGGEELDGRPIEGDIPIAKEAQHWLQNALPLPLAGNQGGKVYAVRKGSKVVSLLHTHHLSEVGVVGELYTLDGERPLDVMSRKHGIMELDPRKWWKLSGVEDVTSKLTKNSWMQQSGKTFFRVRAPWTGVDGNADYVHMR